MRDDRDPTVGGGVSLGSGLLGIAPALATPEPTPEPTPDPTDVLPSLPPLP